MNADTFMVLKPLRLERYFMVEFIIIVVFAEKFVKSITKFVKNVTKLIKACKTKT